MLEQYNLIKYSFYFNIITHARRKIQIAHQCIAIQAIKGQTFYDNQTTCQVLIQHT